MERNQMKGDRMKRQDNKKFRVNISLDRDTHDLLVRLADEGGYETVSRAVRSLVKKYAKHELDPFDSQAGFVGTSENQISK
jgi:hypothetical protein